MRKSVKLLKTAALFISLILILLSISALSCAAKANSEDETATECMSEDLTEPTGVEYVETAAAAAQLELNAKSAALIECDTGTVLFKKNSHERLAPASVTKVMSLLLVMEAIDAGKLTLDTKITSSEHAASMGGSQIWLEPNEVMTVDELLRAAVIASANDATVALAEAVSGSDEGFVAAMNSRAAELGLSDCNFVNPTGLDAENHYMSAYDIAVISAELLRHPLIKKYSTVWMDTLRDGKTGLVNTNKLVRFYEGTTGLKTGTTDKAGCCLSASAQRGNLSVVAVVMGADTSKDRFADARKLLDYAFANFERRTVAVDKASLLPVKVSGGIKSEISVAPESDAELLLQKGMTDGLSQEVKLKKSVSAPVKKGDAVGVCNIKYNGDIIKKVNILAAEDAGKLKFLSGLKCLLGEILRF